MSRVAIVAAFVLALTVAPRAQAQMGPAGKGSYLNLRGMMMSSPAPGGPYDGGASVEWGSFQNKYFGAGTLLSVITDRTAPGATGGFKGALFLGGGPQAHIPLGENVLLIPALTLGLRIANSFGYAGYFSFAAAYRQDSFYVGLEGQNPILQQGVGGMQLFPWQPGANLLVGFYY